MSNARDASLPAERQRLGSVDAYRGFVMLLMMAEVLHLRRVAEALPDSSLWQFLAWHQTHVPWVGCTLHDLIQPSFSFLVGVSVPFSLASREARGQSRRRMVVHAVWRAVVLVLLGVFLRSMARPHTNWTFEDTLSQIGLGYVPLFLLGFASARWRWAALALTVAGYWLAFVVYPAPPADFPYPSVGVPADWPHHATGLAAHWNKNSNLAWWFDTWWLNQFPREQPFTHNAGGYATLSFIPTFATMVLGLIAGQWLKSEVRDGQRIGRMLGTAAVLFVLGLAADRWGLCPLVKRIWTPSWVLFSGGWCFVILAAFYGVIDAAKLSSWSFPLRVVGANSIAAYLLAHGPDRFILESFRIHFGEAIFVWCGSAYEPLLAGSAVLAVQWLILWWMYRRRIFLRL